jgi:hypothetical protein
MSSPERDTHQRLTRNVGELLQELGVAQNGGAVRAALARPAEEVRRLSAVWPCPAAVPVMTW